MSVPHKSTDSDAELLSQLLRGLAAMDDCTVPASSVTVHNELILRLAYVFLIHPEDLRDELRAAGNPSDAGAMETSLLACGDDKAGRLLF